MVCVGGNGLVYGIWNGIVSYIVLEGEVEILGKDDLRYPVWRLKDRKSVV